MATKQSFFNNARVRYKGKNLFVKKWITAKMIFLSHMVSGNIWKSKQDIRKEIGDYAGLYFQHGVNNQCDEKRIERSDAKCYECHYRGRKKQREQAA